MLAAGNTDSHYMPDTGYFAFAAALLDAMAL